MVFRCLVALVIASLPSLAGAAATLLHGHTAIADARPTTTATLEAVPVADDPAVDRLTIVFRTAGRAKPVRHFDVDLTKLMHLVIVGDDLRSFAHVHPVLHADGRFTIVAHFPGPGLYHLYADALPHGLGHQVERFDLAVAGGGRARARDRAPTGTHVRVGPYDVVLDRVRVHVGRENRIVAHLSRNREPARDLQPYLGARAHVVLIDTVTLEYIHVHPEAPGDADMGDMGTGAPMRMPALADRAHVEPDMVLHVTPPRVGAYKLWFQFRGGTRVYVAPFLITADDRA